MTERPSTSLSAGPSTSLRASVAPVLRIDGKQVRTDQDLVAVEAPMAIHVHHAGAPARSLGILMRTPGDDEELAVGLLFTEGVLRSREDIIAIECGAVQQVDESDDRADVVDVAVSTDIDLDVVLARPLTPTSACGLCGRLSMTSVPRRTRGEAIAVPPHVIAALPEKLRGRQSVFAETGGLHAAALATPAGDLESVREDVGRHNAVDKLVGAALIAGRLPSQAVLVVSGRVAFEIVQKAAAAGIEMIVAVGAPSSLAVSAARSADITLVGFVRDGRFNVYGGKHRIGLH